MYINYIIHHCNLVEIVVRTNYYQKCCQYEFIIVRHQLTVVCYLNESYHQPALLFGINQD